MNKFRVEAKKQAIGKESMMQSDGWTGINHHHLVAFMITVNKKVHYAEIGVVHFKE